MVDITVHVTGRDQLSRLAARLRRAATGGLQRELTQAITREAQPALREVRRAWLGVEVTSTRGGGSHSGLRSRVAAATQTQQLGSGVRFEVEPSRVDPAYGRSLSFGLNGMGRWRHPVFGNQAVWTGQQGQEVFFRTLRSREPAWRARLEQACVRVARQIEG